MRDPAYCVSPHLRRNCKTGREEPRKCDLRTAQASLAALLQILDFNSPQFYVAQTLWNSPFILCDTNMMTNHHQLVWRKHYCNSPSIGVALTLSQAWWNFPSILCGTDIMELPVHFVWRKHYHNSPFNFLRWNVTSLSCANLCTYTRTRTVQSTQIRYR